MTRQRPAGVAGRQEKAAATRRQLIAAATAEFSERGYGDTTVRAITTRAETAHGTFYLYFGNTEDIFGAVIEGVIIDRLLVEVAAPLEREPLEALADWVRRFVLVVHEHAGLWMALLEGMLASEVVRALWLGLRRRMVNSLVEAFRERQEEGTIPQFDAVMVAHSLSAMLEWSSFTHLVLGEPGPDADPEIERLVGAVTGVWYRSVYGRVPDGVAPPALDAAAHSAPRRADLDDRADGAGHTAPSA